MKRELLSPTCKEVERLIWAKYFCFRDCLKYSVCACVCVPGSLCLHFVNVSHEDDLQANVLPWVWLSSSHILQQQIHLRRIPLHGYLTHRAAVTVTSISSPWHEKARPKQNVAIIVCLCHPFVPEEEEEIFVKSALYAAEQKQRI